VPVADTAFAVYVYALCMSGRLDEARAAIREPWEQSLRDRGIPAAKAALTPLPPYWDWIRATFGVDPRH
jgi:hypothetical protein